MIRALLIDPIAETITEIHIAKTLKAMQSVVGGYIAIGHRFDGEIEHDVYVNDEGLSVPDTAFFCIDGGQPLAGVGLITAADSEGETIAATLTKEFVKEKVLFLGRYEDVRMQVYMATHDF